MSATQEHAGRQLAGPAESRFSTVGWRATENGAVLIDSSAGFETSIEQQVSAGDHDIVVLRVHEMHVDQDINPLVFHRSAFRRLEL